MTSAVPAAVAAYLDSLTADKRANVEPVFETVAAAMPDGYELGIHFGMPGWVIPLERYPDTYNKKPLSYVSLASGKRYNSLYIMGPYLEPGHDAAFREKWAERGLKLDMGKSCLRYRDVNTLALDIIAEEIASVTPERYIELYEKSRA